MKRINESILNGIAMWPSHWYQIRTELKAAITVLFLVLISGPAFGSGSGYVETTCSTSRGTLEARLHAPGEDVLLSSRAVVHIYDHFGNSIDRIDKHIDQMFLQAHEKATLIYRDATPQMASCELELRERIVQPAAQPQAPEYVEPATSTVSYQYVHQYPPTRVYVGQRHHHRNRHVIVHDHHRRHRDKHIIIKKRHQRPTRHHHNRVIIQHRRPHWQGHIRVNL